MQSQSKKILITGCAGFLGSHAVELFLKDKEYNIIGLDKLTYAANKDNLNSFKNNSRFKFYQGDICDKSFVENISDRHSIEWIINFAAETHVDNSIDDSLIFLHSNIIGVHNLLEVCKSKNIKLLQISTDEVYGEAVSSAYREDSNLSPRNPYSATKAAAEHLINAHANTFQVKFLIVRPSNNYGPRQHNEKFIPTILNSLATGKKVPIYGDGLQIREWTYVKDTVKAVKFILENSKMNECYNISSNIEMTNLSLLNTLCKKTGSEIKSSVKHVKDRKGHDRRYSVNSSKLKKIGFKNYTDFNTSIEETVSHYLEEK